MCMYIKIYNVSKKAKVDAKSRCCSAYIESLINIQKKIILLKNSFCWHMFILNYCF